MYYFVKRKMYYATIAAITHLIVNKKNIITLRYNNTNVLGTYFIYENRA